MLLVHFLPTSCSIDARPFTPLLDKRRDALASSRGLEGRISTRSKAASFESVGEEPVELRYYADPEFAIAFLMQDLVRLRRRLLDNTLVSLGLTRTQGLTLGNLSLRNAEGITQSELARLMDVNKVSIGATIDQLQNASYLIRKFDRDDKRVRRLYLTSKGKKAVEHMKKAVLRLHSQLHDGITERDLAITERTLERMRLNHQIVLGEETLLD